MTKNRGDLITIGITCYNAQETISRAIESALTQDYQDFEILIVDDSSTDNSLAIVDGYAKKYKHIRVLSHSENKGASAARQTIINNAAGEFVAFFDDDDVASKDRISEQHRVICDYESNFAQNTLVVCYASGTRIYPNGYSLDIDAIGSRDGAVIGNLVAGYILFFQKEKGVFYGAGTPTCSLMARTNTFKAVGGFDPSFKRVEDLDFAIRVSLSGGHFIGTKKRVFTQYATFSGDKAYQKNMVAEVQLAQKHKAYLDSVGRYRYALTWPKVRYYHFKRNYVYMLAVLSYLFFFYPLPVLRQFLVNAPKRLIHEIKMGKKEQT